MEASGRICRLGAFSMSYTGFMPARRLLPLGQGAYYLLTGAWPLVHDRSFQAVTGPKVDVWLVRTVGVLVSVIGGVLLLAGLRRTVVAEVPALAMGSAAGLATSAVTHVRRGRISPVDLLDAALEAALVSGWARLLLSEIPDEQPGSTGRWVTLAVRSRISRNDAAEKRGTRA